MFVVTGTPRSATGYASLLFTALGLKCSHEQVFRPRCSPDDILDWLAKDDNRGDSSYLAWVFLSQIPQPISVLHTVRDPWKVVDSLAHRNDLLQTDHSLNPGRARHRKILMAFCPQLAACKTDIERAATLVIHWNRSIEETTKASRHTYHRYRVEDVGLQSVDEMLSWVGAYRDAIEIDRALGETPRNVNAGKRLERDVVIDEDSVVGRDVLQWLRTRHPDLKPVINIAKTHDVPRTPDELESGMAPELRDGLAEIAERYGYSRDVETKNETSVTGVPENESV